MKRFISILFVTLLSIFILTNLSFAQKKAAKDMQVVVVIKDLLNPCFIEMKWGGFAAAKESGIQYNCLAPEKYSVDNQIRIVEDLVQKKVDAIVLIPIDGKGIVSGIERANKAGIPVFICNTRAEGGETLGFAGIDHKAMGVTIGEYVGKRLKGKGQIIILEGTTGASTAIDRLDGVMESLKKYPDIKILASTTAKYQRQMGMKVMEDLLIRFPKIDAVIGINDSMALGAKEAIKDAKRLNEIFIVGIDATPESVDNLRNGELAATVDANCFWQAFVSVDLACKYLLKGVKPERDTKIGSGMPEVITKENLDKFLKFKADLYAKYGLKPIEGLRHP
jgi:ribose transport system substrate-binding protein